jgi:ectoine hydroxylase-related dioxygenase (phytanoyl-CoA dioxygenase family)
MLSKKQIASYREKGYLGVEGVLGQREVEELRRVADEFVEKSRAVTQSDDVFDLEPGHSPESPKLRRLKSPAAQHPVYDRALRHEKILDMVAQLVGPSIRYNGHKLNMKSGQFGSPVEWHQDWAFYPHTNDDLLAVGICIDDMSEENGCLLVIPGSHRGPVLDHTQDGRFVGAVTDPAFDDTGAEKVELKAGGISLHHVRALHGSLPNTSSRPRRLLLFQYCAGDAWPLTGANWETWESTLLRGELTYQPRVTPVPVRLPLPPALKHGSIYETQTVLRQSTFRKTRAAG